jgi:uncharacterized glyoxalase superfamily protein PhnB
MTNRSSPPGTIIPSLIYTDVAAAIDFLCGAFGFTERLRIGGSDGRAGHAQLEFGGGGVMLGEGRNGFRPPRPGEISVTITVRVDDIDRHFEQARLFGARIEQPPTDHPYGERQYSAEDPEGHRWAFTQAIADVDPKDWGAKKAE